jgi:hypothetical protein
MTENTPQEIFESMSLSNILVAILGTLKEVNVPRLTFINSGEDKQMQIDYNDEDDSFVFKLKDKVKEEESLVNDFE